MFEISYIIPQDNFHLPTQKGSIVSKVLYIGYFATLKYVLSW